MRNVHCLLLEQETESDQHQAPKTRLPLSAPMEIAATARRAWRVGCDSAGAFRFGQPSSGFLDGYVLRLILGDRPQ
jgi:hypothetical protein